MMIDNFPHRLYLTLFPLFFKRTSQKVIRTFQPCWTLSSDRHWHEGQAEILNLTSFEDLMVILTLV